MWGIIGQILAPMLPKLFDYIGGLIGGVGRSIGNKYTSYAKKKKTKTAVEIQRERHIEAIRSAYDGENISPEQKKELDDSFRELTRDY